MRSSSDPASPASAAPLVVFDFDGTLTRCDSLLPFLRACSGRLRFWGGLAILIPGTLIRMTFQSRGRLKEVLLQHFLQGRTETELLRTAEHFCGGRLRRLMNDAMLERLAWHRQAGHRVILLSASPQLYLDVWARPHGVHEVVATRIEFRDGVCTGRLLSENCRGEEKVQRLALHCGAAAMKIEYAYGDSPADRPLLERATHPCYRGYRDRGYSARSFMLFIRELL